MLSCFFFPNALTVTNEIPTTSTPKNTVGIMTEYFKDHQYITTKDLQYLSGLSNHTALRRLKERVEAGKMTHPGHRYSAFYFPVPGNYGISTDKE